MQLQLDAMSAWVEAGILTAKECTCGDRVGSSFWGKAQAIIADAYVFIMACVLRLLLLRVSLLCRVSMGLAAASEFMMC